MADKDFKVKSGLDLSVPLPVSMGGTGQTSTNNTLNSLLPAQAGNTSKFLQTNGTNVSWIEAAPLASPTFTGNVVLPSTTTYSGTNIQTSLDAKSNKTKPLSTKIADYTLTTSDNDTLIEFNSSSDLNLTLPTYSNAAFSYGDNFSIVNRGSGKVNILNQSGTTSLSSYSTTGTGTSVVYSSLYANSMYICQAGTSYYRSTDAITWSQISGISSGTTVTNNNQRIAYGAGLYIIGASNGIWSSSNGITWTQRLSVGQILAIKYANNKFIAGGNDGAAYTSTDGLTWTSLGVVASLSTQDFINIEYVSGISTWFATLTGSPYLIKSVDNGATWTQITGNANAKSLATDGNILVLNNGGSSSSVFYTTTDGNTLTSRSIGGSFFQGKPIYDGTKFIFGYTSISSPFTLYQYTSSNGINWSVQSSTSATGQSAANTLMIGASGQYIYLGSIGIGYTSGSVTASYISKNNSSYIPPKGRAEIYNYNQNQFVVSGDLGIDNSVSSNITLVSGNNYYVDTTAARTLTLPASPSVGDQIEIFDASGTAGTYNITLDRNNKLINGNAGNFIIDVNGGWYTLVFTGNTYGWVVR